MFKVFVWFLVLASVALVVLLSTEVKAVDIVTARIECPEITILKWDWKNRIGSNPPFHLIRYPTNEYEKQWGVPFEKSERFSQQMILCWYRMPNSSPPMLAKYGYGVRRKIISCTGFPGRVIECKLEK